MARKTGIPTKTIPVRFSPDLMALVKTAAAAMNWKEVDVIRLCTEIGLVRLKRINYDLATVIDYAADAPPLKEEPEQARAAEEPGDYQAGKMKKKAK